MWKNQIPTSVTKSLEEDVILSTSTLCQATIVTTLTTAGS